MKLTEKSPPRIFQTGRGNPILIRDCGTIALSPNEQITFVTENGAEYDVARKSWGFYATPSLNGRLASFGLRACLVRSYVQKYYIMLVVQGLENEFAQYLEQEQNEIIRWLDNDEDLITLVGSDVSKENINNHFIRCPCGVNRLISVHMYFEKPPGEISFPFNSGLYRRELFQCSVCSHFLSIHTMDTQNLYSGEYVQSTYGSIEGIRQSFSRIMNLPPEKSDNTARVKRVCTYAQRVFNQNIQDSHLHLLDIGSGLGVFVARMAAEGWQCSALDPDPAACMHLTEIDSIQAIQGTLEDNPIENAQYDCITLNKVLEHVQDPIDMLQKTYPYLRSAGFVYVEVPDGVAAARDGFHREEFFIEHHHVFSLESLSIAAKRAGYEVCLAERIQEPSSKYTIFAFLRKYTGSL